jgi:hypothetical protein
LFSHGSDWTIKILSGTVICDSILGAVLLYMMAGMCSRFRPEECWRIMLYYDKIDGRNDQKQDLWEVPEDGKNI